MGVEGDLDWANLTGKSSRTINFNGAPIGTATLSSNVSALGTLRSRVGYAFDNWLVFGTAGLAVTDEKSSLTRPLGFVCGVGTPSSPPCSSYQTFIPAWRWVVVSSTASHKLSAPRSNTCGLARVPSTRCKKTSFAPVSTFALECEWHLGFFADGSLKLSSSCNRETPISVERHPPALDHSPMDGGASRKDHARRVKERTNEARRLICARQIIAPPLPPGSPPCGAGGYVHEPSRFSMCFKSWRKA
jgi:hypothetical protein